MSLATGTYAIFSTTEGKITVRLFEADAPITVKNFIDLAEGTREWTHPVTRAKSSDKLYDGTIFHRVIPDFMIQAGDPAGTGMGGPGYKFGDETKGSPHTFEKPGMLAMANAGPGTNGSQFFLTVAPTPWLIANRLNTDNPQPRLGVVCLCPSGKSDVQEHSHQKTFTSRPATNCMPSTRSFCRLLSCVRKISTPEAEAQAR